MLFAGVGTALIGAMARDLSLAPVDIGLLLGAENLAFAFTVVIAGRLSDRASKPHLAAAGSMTLALGFGLFYLSPGLLPNLAVMALVGAGIGLVEAATDPMLMEMPGEGQGRRVSFNHFALTLGTVFITAWLLVAPLPWRPSLVGMAVAAAGPALLFLQLPTQHSPRDETTSSPPPGLASLWLAGAAVFLAVGVELGTGGLLTTFLAVEEGLDGHQAQLGLLLFLVGVATGRGLAGGLVADKHLGAVTLLLALLTVPAAAFLFQVAHGWLALAAALGLGLVLSAQVPLLLTLVGQAHPQVRGQALGLLKLAIPLGGALVPLAVSGLQTRLSLRDSLWLFPALALLNLGVVWRVSRRV